MNIDPFFLAINFGIICFFLGIAEFIAMQFFVRFIYKAGFKLYSSVSDLPQPSEKDINAGTILMDEGKFKCISRSECLFTSRLQPFKFFRLSTPFPFKGRVVWSENVAIITGRIPIGTTLFITSWLLVWSSSAFYGINITFIMTGWLFWAVFIAWSIPVEKRRMENMVDELKLILMNKR